MAGDTPSSVEGGFGQVSRTVGSAFRYALLASTLAGIVALGILLLYVANDAFQPLTADPGWHLTFFLTLVLPTLAVGGYLYARHFRALVTGLTAFFLPAVGLLFAGGMAAIFIDVIPPLVWLSYVVALAVPVAVSLAMTAVDDRVPFLARLVAVAVTVVGSLLVVPGFVQQIPFIPTDWMIMALTLGGVAAAVAWWYAGDKWGARAGAVAAAGTFVGIAAFSMLGPFVGLNPLPASIVASIALAPTGLYVAGVALDRPRERVGLVLPVVIVGGTLLGAFLANQFGFAGPESYLDWNFVTSTVQSLDPAEVGIYPGIVGSILLMFAVALTSFPVGVGAAVYLEEYAPDNTVTRIIDVNINNLAGVPSVVYGLLGLGIFIRYGGWGPGTLAVAAAALSLLILPIIIISAREAIRSVPDSMSQASYGMGATRWQTVRNVILPEAFPGILTGTILALSRAIGETAPLLIVGAAQVFPVPDSLDSVIGAMPLQLFVWATTFASPEFYSTVLAAGIVVILAAMLTMNSIAIVLRNRYQSER